MGAGLLESIGSPQDLKALDEGLLDGLCAQIRRTLIDYGHRHGGHIGSNLGMVEATVALHRVFDSPRDRIVFDVSHQAYVHKMLTGRAWAYLDPARADEVTGFTNPAESEHDQFTLGHTGTSVSLACGLAKTRDLTGGTGAVVAVIGDGSLSSGVAFEGLNNAAEQGGNLIIVFNDNEMSIAGDFGGMYGPLARLRASGGTAQPNIFNAFGLDYRYVERGNDVHALIDAFEEVKDIDHPVVVHIHTVKGLGLPAGPGTEAAAVDAVAGDSGNDGTCRNSTGAIATSGTAGIAGIPAADSCDLSGPHPHAGRCEASHWMNPDSAIGKPDDPRKHYGKLAMAALEKRFAAEPGLTVISPATPGSNGITHGFRVRAGAHYVDTGITEQHAVAYAAGIARAGGTPVVATTASFFQRAYDQFFQELGLSQLPVTLLVFLGGLSGTDNTHSGAYDLTMFGNIPGLTCLAPTSGEEFLAMLEWATAPERRDSDVPGAVVIRVPGERVLEVERARGDAGSAGMAADGGLMVSPPPAAQEPPLARGDQEGENAGLMSAGQNQDDGFVPSKYASNDKSTFPFGYEVAQAGRTVALLGLGNAYPLAVRAAALLRKRDGIEATVVNPRVFSSLDMDVLEALRGGHRLIVTLEDGQLEGGWGEKVTAWYANHPDADPARNPKVLNVGADKEFTDRVPLADLEQRYGLTPQQIVTKVEATLL